MPILSGKVVVSAMIGTCTKTSTQGHLTTFAWVLQAPAVRPDRTEKAVHHRVYPPLAAQGALEADEEDPDLQVVRVSPGRSAKLYISPGEYRDKVLEVC